MTPLGAGIGALLIAEYLLHMAADLLNLKASGRRPPPIVADLYPPETRRRHQDYLAANTRLGMVRRTVDLGLLLAFWAAGGFAALDRLARSGAWGETLGIGWGPVAAGMVFIGALAMAGGLIHLPFSVYRTFVIEERFGFNRATPATFMADLLKGAALALLLGTPLLWGVLAFFQHAGNGAWLYCWGLIIVFSLALTYVAPTWIMPLFNRFEPLPEGELRRAIFAYARSVDYPVRNIMVMDGSRRSAKSNAFFTGFGRRRRIALFDTLVERHCVAELVAILAHEIGHYRLRHIPVGITLGILRAGAMFFLLSLALEWRPLYAAFGLDHMPAGAGLVFFSLIYGPLSEAAEAPMMALSRRNEYAADRFAAETTGDPAALAEGLRKLSVHNLSNPTPHGLYVWLHYSHPPLARRLERLNR